MFTEICTQLHWSSFLSNPVSTFMTITLYSLSGILLCLSHLALFLTFCLGLSFGTHYSASSYFDSPCLFLCRSTVSSGLKIVAFCTGYSVVPGTRTRSSRFSYVPYCCGWARRAVSVLLVRVCSQHCLMKGSYVTAVSGLVGWVNP